MCERAVATRTSPIAEHTHEAPYTGCLAQAAFWAPVYGQRGFGWLVFACKFFCGTHVGRVKKHLQNRGCAPRSAYQSTKDKKGRANSAAAAPVTWKRACAAMYLKPAAYSVVVGQSQDMLCTW